MLYEAYLAREDFLAPLRGWAELASAALKHDLAGPVLNPLLRAMGAGAEVAAGLRLTHTRPAYGIASVEMDGRSVAVREEAALATPFGTLLHFRKATDTVQPRVLVVAPMAGHFATLLRHTVRVLLPEHDVFITDWNNARDVARGHGRFGVEDYIDHLVRFLERIGPGAHAVGVCQPCAALLAAVALMAEDGHPCRPRSMTLMAGPVDTRVNPTEVNRFATEHSLDWFERHLVTAVPGRYAGAGRHVYPGFLQATAFVSMNVARHWRAHAELFDNLAKGDLARATGIRGFYDEYFAVFDLPAEFYLETVRAVFQEHHLPRGRFAYRGRTVDPSTIRDTALLTIEGEHDDICAPGQTRAAHALCTGIAPARKAHHLQPGAGHYGVFSGHRWEREIYPAVRDVIAENE